MLLKTDEINKKYLHKLDKCVGVLGKLYSIPPYWRKTVGGPYKIIFLEVNLFLRYLSNSNTL